MSTTPLAQQLKELERLYRTNKRKLLVAKAIVILLGVLSLLYAYYDLHLHAAFRHLKSYEALEAFVVVAFFVLPGIILTPLYKFFSDRVENKINWDIKMSIFDTALSKYNTEYNVSFKGLLPFEDIQLLQFDNGFTKFAYGDDLIFGKINSFTFRLSEVHSINFLGKSFHGIAAVLIDPHFSEKSTPKLFNFKSDSQVINHREKYFLLKSNKKNLFEFSIHKDQINKSSLESDFQFFDKFIQELHEMSVKLSEQVGK